MAEKDDRQHAHKRNVYSHRARPGQNRIYQNFGVRDLRELLDRKRSEKGQIAEGSIPPPDPSYNYLKDPLRENANENQPRHYNTRKPQNKNYSNNPRKDKDQQSVNPTKNKDIENPLNIKVEFSTSTGEHVYKLDESTVLPTIKHVPDQLPPPQNRSFRGRGRGRPRGQYRTYQSRTIRNNSSNKKPTIEGASADHPLEETCDTGENWDNDQTKEIVNEEQEVDEEQVDTQLLEENEEHLQDEESLQEQTEDIEKNVENLKLDDDEKHEKKETDQKD